MNAKRRVIPPIDDDDFRPTELECLAALVSKTGSIREFSAARPMTIRVPLHDFFRIKALADYSGLSMNQISVHLFRAALEALAAELPSADSESVRKLADGMHWEARKESADSYVVPEEGAPC